MTRARTAPRNVLISTCGTIHAAMNSAAAATSHDRRSLNGLIFGRTSRCSGVLWGRAFTDLLSVGESYRANTDACEALRALLAVPAATHRRRARRSRGRRPTWRPRSSGRASTPRGELSLRREVEVAVVVVRAEPVAERDHALDLLAPVGERVHVDVRVRTARQPVLEPVGLADPQHVACGLERRHVVVLVPCRRRRARCR